MNEGFRNYKDILRILGKIFLGIFVQVSLKHQQTNIVLLTTIALLRMLMKFPILQ